KILVVLVSLQHNRITNRVNLIKMISTIFDFLILTASMLVQMIFLYFLTRYNSGNAEKQFNAKMTSALKKQQKSISELSEIVKLLGYDIREVRDGGARS